MQGIKLECKCGWKPAPEQLIHIVGSIKKPLVYVCPDCCGDLAIEKILRPLDEEDFVTQEAFKRLKEYLGLTKFPQNPLGNERLVDIEKSLLTVTEAVQEIREYLGLRKSTQNPLGKDRIAEIQRRQDILKRAVAKCIESLQLIFKQFKEGI